VVKIERIEQERREAAEKPSFGKKIEKRLVQKNGIPIMRSH
jgi:hypothetical protein